MDDERSEGSAWRLAMEGCSAPVASTYRSRTDRGCELGRVTRVDRGQPLVLTSSGVVRAEQAAQSREGRDTRVAVGDWVAIARPDGHDRAILAEVLPRTSAFVRRDPGKHVAEQVVVANADVVFVVQAMSVGAVNLSRLERELVLAWESGARPVVVLTKADLAIDREATFSEVVSVAAGVEVLVTCAITGEGVDAIPQRLGRGRTGVLLGASGVGKSTLVNRLLGEEVQQTAEVRLADGKGRHTTVAREMFFLPDGSILIDTPGMRGLALWSADAGFKGAFPEIDELAASCRFDDCTHGSEPGCAVSESVARQELAPRRVESYRALRAEAEGVGERREVRSRAASRKASRAR